MNWEPVSPLSDIENEINNVVQEDPMPPCAVIDLDSKPLNTSSSLCRLCAGRTTDPIYIYSEFGESLHLADKINACLSIKVRKTDLLPKQLCVHCVEKINWNNAFDLQCIEAEETLSMILNDNKINEVQHKIINKVCDDQDPLCLEDHMVTIVENLEETYQNPIVISSSDEDNLLKHLQLENTNKLEGTSVIPQDLNNGLEQDNASMNFYRSKESPDSHKYKLSTQNTLQPYKCHICDATFPFEERLKFHEQFHQSAKSLNCDICKITFNKEQKLFHHYKRYHCDSSTISCLQCGKFFEDQSELRAHVCLDGKTRPHICEVCNKGFTDGYTLKRHVVTHLPEKPFKCNQCPKSFTQKSRLNKHVAGHGIIIEHSQTCWKCLECGEIFASCEEAGHHYKVHEKTIRLIEEFSATKVYHCEFCNSFFIEAQTLKTHQSTHKAEKSFSCNICLTDFKSYSEAVAHWKKHPRAFKIMTVFMCNVCNKDTKELSLLYKHKRKRQHFTPRTSTTGEQKYICELCAGLFSKMEEIINHEREACSKFPCDICGSLLPTATSLGAHKRRHSGLRPYVCNICGKSYTQSSHMWTHKRFHMGVKPYACEFCDQKFTIKPDLADHTRKKHTRERPFKCDVCNKAFLTGSVFYQHRLIHRGDRRYKCNLCDKAFTRTEALNNHVKIHTGEKPHACDVCGRSFRQKGDMRKHRRTQHGVKDDEMVFNGQIVESLDDIVGIIDT